MRTKLILGLVLVVGCSKSASKNATDEVGTTTITSAPVVIVAGEPDPQITRRVEATLAADPDMSRSARSVEVSVVEGIVTLTGPVDDPETRETISTLARRVRGVKDVLDKTYVSSADNTPDRADDQISYDLERGLAFDPSVSRDGESVTIDVTNGVVTLRGNTADEATKRSVQQLAEQTPGVIAVKNRLGVR